MLRRRASPPEEDKKDIFAPVADLMVGVVFIFIIMMIALSLNLRDEASVPQSAYQARTAEAARARMELAISQSSASAARQQAEAQEVRDGKLAGFAAFVRDSRVRKLLEDMSGDDQTRTAMLQDMQRRLSSMGVDASIDADAGTLAVPSRNLFDSGQTDPTPEGARIIGILGAVMASTLPCHAASPAAACPAPPPGGETSLLSAVYVEGHTDITSYGGGSGTRFRDNWDLSAARAIAAYKLIEDRYDMLRNLHNAQGESLLGVSGYAETRPAVRGAVDRNTPEMRDKDRRIEIRLVMSANPQTVGGVLQELNGKLESLDAP